MKYIVRSAESRLRRLVEGFPALLILGPRQCGKSTLARHLLPDWRFLDLERPADFAVLTSDLEGFFDANPGRLVIDEAQRLPELFPVLRHVIDKGEGNGRFVLLGSASPPLLRTASESLAGRLAQLELTPLLASELALAETTGDRWFWGGFPPVHAAADTATQVEWLGNYVTSYLERDLPALGLRLSAQRLRILWTMLAHVHGNPLNQSDLGRSLGVSVPTVQNHLDVLEGTFMLRRLPPFFANLQKRFTKAPKLYVRDSGLLHHLAGLRVEAELETWPRKGASFEGLVVEELIALANATLTRPEFYCWRTAAGGEVDLLVVVGQQVYPIEIKLGSAVDPRSLSGLRHCLEDLGLKQGWVVSSARESSSIGGGIRVLSWSRLIRGLEPLPWEH